MGRKTVTKIYRRATFTRHTVVAHPNTPMSRKCSALGLDSTAFVDFAALDKDELKEEAPPLRAPQERRMSRSVPASFSDAEPPTFFAIKIDENHFDKPEKSEEPKEEDTATGRINTIKYDSDSLYQRRQDLEGSHD